MSRTIASRHNRKGIIIKLWCGKSDKKDKRKANRSFRRLEKIDAKRSLLAEDDLFNYRNIKEVSDTWSFRSDGLSQYLDLSDYEKEEYNRLKSK